MNPIEYYCKSEVNHSLFWRDFLINFFSSQVFLFPDLIQMSKVNKRKKDHVVQTVMSKWEEEKNNKKFIPHKKKSYFIRYFDKETTDDNVVKYVGWNHNEISSLFYLFHRKRAKFEQKWEPTHWKVIW